VSRGPAKEEHDLASDRLSIPRALALVLVLPLALGACGRKGPLDPPPSAAIPPPGPAAPGAPTAAPTTSVDPMTPAGAAEQAQPAPVQTTQTNPPPQGPKTFLLDPLIR